MEAENEDVMLGKLLDDHSYQRDEKHINIDGLISIDFIKEENELHEIKKSRAIEEAGIWQVKYYLYYLKKKEVAGLKAKIDYPLIKKNMLVELNEEDEKTLEKVFDGIEVIRDLEVAPCVEKMRICNKCAYFDLCFI